MAAYGNQITDADGVAFVMGVLSDMGMSSRWSGLCVWIEGEPDSRQRLALVEMGARYSVKRGAWYFRADDGIDYGGKAA